VATQESLDATPVIEQLGGEEEIRRRLTEQRAEIIALYQNDLRAGQEASDEGSDDLVDRANNAYNRELMFSLSDGERETLLKIEEALQRLESGGYGVCVHCDTAIPLARLEAMPWARYCVDCQELAERQMLEED
jgi:DnaK suppressor protein